MHEPQAGEASDDDHACLCPIDDRMLVWCARIEARPALEDRGSLDLDPEREARLRQIGNSTPIASATCGAHAPAQLTTASVWIVPPVVFTALIASASTANPVTSEPHSIVAPAYSAAVATPRSARC